eukprot:3639287-Alexandrium_andersonii.AAC.1
MARYQNTSHNKKHTSNSYGSSACTIRITMALRMVARGCGDGAGAGSRRGDGDTDDGGADNNGGAKGLNHTPLITALAARPAITRAWTRLIIGGCAGRGEPRVR